jgi:two-component system response regulator YesN
MTGYSLIIVDDETSARKMIRASVDWLRMNIRHCFEAADGFSALRIIREKSPDIMILDIKMPEMSGIELINRMKKENLNAKVIISSGYSDFGAAQKLIKSGMVMGYLLKPIDGDFLTETLTECIEKIDDERYASRAVEDLMRARKFIRRRVVRDAIYGRAEELDDSIFSEWVAKGMCVAIAAVKGNVMQFKYCCEKFIMQGGLSDVFCGEIPNTVVMYFESSLEKMYEEALELCSRIAEDLGCVIGLGRECKSRYDLNISYAEAVFACESRSFIERRVITLSDIDSRLHDNEDEDICGLKSIMAGGNTERVEGFLRSLVERCRIRLPYMGIDLAIGKPDMGMMKAYMARLFKRAFSADENANISTIYSARTSEELINIAKSIAVQCMEVSEDGCTLRKRNLVAHAKEYIKKYYADRITLETVANAIYICPSYLSRLFSEVGGCTFVEYVTLVRVEKAKEFLIKREYKIYEVAEMVGYHNVKHFIRVFKDVTRMTPSQFREEHIFDKAFQD